MNINDALNGMIGHKVEISFTHQGASALKTVAGVLEAVDKDLIILRISDLYSEGGTLHLNRHSTLIISVTDYGEVRV